MAYNLPKHYAQVEVLPKTRFGWFGMAIGKTWRGMGSIPVFADVCGVVVALGIGVTGIGEYAGALCLLVFAALALTSKLWHSENVPFLRVFGTCSIAIVLLIFSAIIWDAKGDNDWSHLPHASHRLMVAFGISKEKVPLAPPRPQFAHDIRISHDHPYRKGIIIDGIKWRDDLREYFFTIQNISQNVEVSNFREHLFLPVAALQMEIVSCLGCEGVSISMGDGSSKTVIIQDGKIVRTDDNSGMNDVSVAVSRMLPEAMLTIKMIASTTVANPDKTPGVMMYGSNFFTPSGLWHFGRMIRFMTLAEDGKINIGPELHKRGRTFPVPIIWSIGGPLPESSQAITPGVRVSQDVYDKPDDE